MYTIQYKLQNEAFNYSNKSGKFFKKIFWMYNIKKNIMDIWIIEYRQSPTYTKITNTVSTTMVFGLCICKWGN